MSTDKVFWEAARGASFSILQAKMQESQELSPGLGWGAESAQICLLIWYHVILKMRGGMDSQKITKLAHATNEQSLLENNH